MEETPHNQACTVVLLGPRRGFEGLLAGLAGFRIHFCEEVFAATVEIARIPAGQKVLVIIQTEAPGPFELELLEWLAGESIPAVLVGEDKLIPDSDESKWPRIALEQVPDWLHDLEKKTTPLHQSGPPIPESSNVLNDCDLTQQELDALLG